MPRVVALFEEYALGDLSYRELAREHGLAAGAVRAILTTRLYNGWEVELILALPETVVLARPAGAGRVLATYEILIEGRDAWIAAAERSA